MNKPAIDIIINKLYKIKELDIIKPSAKKIISVVLTLCVLSAIFIPASAADKNADIKKLLQFNSDGTFKIMMINDTQDTDHTSIKMLNFINKALDTEKPDLVVFVCDNVADFFIGATKARVNKAIDNIIQPLVKRGIPFAVVFGNHDEETGVSKEDQMAMYTSYANCYAVDEGSSLSGVGTYNLPILSSDGTKSVFNIYMMDTHNKDVNGDYDGVHADQIAWYEATSNALKAANGGKVVPSLLFEHIPVAEIFKLLKKIPLGTDGAVRNGSKWYTLNENLAQGTLLVNPCNTVANNGQYDSWLKQGDIAGAFFGHDHANNFAGKTEDGIKMGYNGGTGFRAHDNGDKRSIRIFNINENDPANYETHSIYYGDLMNDHFNFYISDIISLRWFDIIFTKVYQIFEKLTLGVFKF